MYFSGNATGGALWTLAAYAVAGTVVSLLATGRARHGVGGIARHVPTLRPSRHGPAERAV
ncbi:hypothetical protein [Streptomyces mirabilis]|uniref:hypothetical protein n=1 Tax=Streptomyces mirabilis TaxID=68239 RepID=UPI003BEEE8EC